MGVERFDIARGKYSKRRAGGTNEGCHRRKCFRGMEFVARKIKRVENAVSIRERSVV
jgi:hypothetical protein